MKKETKMSAKKAEIIRETKRIEREIEQIAEESRRLENGLADNYGFAGALVVADIIYEIQKTILQRREKGEKVGINGGSYLYTPTTKDLRTWRASDGSKFNATLASIILEYADDGFSILDDYESFLVNRKMDQAEWEGFNN